MSATPRYTFDPSSGFTVTMTASSADGLWEYGYETSLGGTFTPYANTTLTWDGVSGLEGYWYPSATFKLPLLLHNPTPTTITAGTVVIPPEYVMLHPGESGEYSTLRFVAPASGQYEVTGWFEGIDDHNTSTDVHIRKTLAGGGGSGEALFNATVNGYGPTSRQPFALTQAQNSAVTLSYGEYVDFLVGSNGGFFFDSTGIVAEVTAKRYMWDLSDDFTIVPTALSAHGTGGAWQYGYWATSAGGPDSFAVFPSGVPTGNTTLTWDGVSNLEGYYHYGGYSSRPLLLRNGGSSTISYGDIVVPSRAVMLQSAPEAQQCATVRFVAPVTGKYNLSGYFEGADTSGTGPDYARGIQIVQTPSMGRGGSGAGLVTLFSSTLTGYGSGSRQSFSFPALQLSARDTVDFVLSEGGIYHAAFQESTLLSVQVSCEAITSIGGGGNTGPVSPLATTYSYDAAGHRVLQVANDVSSAYAYDAAEVLFGSLRPVE